MAELSIKPMTVEEFLRWEEDQPDETRFELIEGIPHMMSPERARHVRVKGAVFTAFGRAINKANAPCEAFVEGLTVPINDRNGYKPDIHVTCETIDGNTCLSEQPVIIIEVLSPSTAGFDKGSKLIGYFQLDSLVHYLLIDPVELTVEHHQRRDGEITKRTLMEGTLELNPPGLKVEVADLFETRW
jgi:Uma2 family endonuclease